MGCIAPQSPRKGLSYEEKFVEQGRQQKKVEGRDLQKQPSSSIVATAPLEAEGITHPEEGFDRIEGKDLMKNPYRSIVAIFCRTDEGRPQSATGVLLSKNILLTVGHAIYYKKMKNTDFKVYHQANGVGKDYYYVESWKYLPQFQGPKMKLELDYALMKLEEDPNLPIDYKDFPQLLVTCEECLKKNEELKIGIFGYPFKYLNNFKYLEEGGIRLFQYGLKLKGRVQSIDHKNFQISYKINTEGGQSGSPIISEENIIGIHNGEKGNVNVGRLITAEMAENILKWNGQLGGDPIQIKYNRGCCKKHEPIMSQIKSSENKAASVENNLANKPIEPIKSLPQLLEVKTEELKIKGDKSQPKNQGHKQEIKKQESKEVTVILLSKQQKPSPIQKQEFPNVPIMPVPQPLVKEQEKAMQVRQEYLWNIVKKLQSIPAQEKQRITSLTLKQTCIIIIIKVVISNQ